MGGKKRASPIPTVSVREESQRKKNGLSEQCDE
jgi:hypothetical protein